jgi:ABC-type taurine transport system ATPase subunit
MKIKELKRLLTLAEKRGAKNVLVACDEEWNVLFKDIEVEINTDDSIVIFGLSGSELELN